MSTNSSRRYYLLIGGLTAVVATSGEALLAGDWAQASRSLVVTGGALLVFVTAFSTYYDGLERVSNGEAVVWATGILVVGFAAILFTSPPLALCGLVATGGYALRRRGSPSENVA